MDELSKVLGPNSVLSPPARARIEAIIERERVAARLDELKLGDRALPAKTSYQQTMPPETAKGAIKVIDVMRSHFRDRTTKLTRGK